MKMKLDQQGLIPVIAQDITTGQVLTMAYTNPGALKRTLEGGQAWFYSRSRQELWHKGAISSNYLNVKESWVDCDGDTILLQVEPTGPTCHTGNTACFFTPLREMPDSFEHAEKGPGILQELFAVIQERRRDLPQGSYTAELFKGSVTRIAQKVIEEAGETALAGSQGDKCALPQEMADLFYHALVLLAATEISPEEVWKVLRERRK